MIGERLSGSGTRLEVSSPVQSAAPTIGGVKSSTESVHRALKSVSRQSLLGNNLRNNKNFVLILILLDRYRFSDL